MKGYRKILSVVAVLLLCCMDAFAVSPLEKLREAPNTLQFIVMNKTALKRAKGELKFPLARVQTGSLDSLVMVIAKNDWDERAYAVEIIREMVADEGMERLLQSQNFDNTQTIFARLDSSGNFYESMLIWAANNQNKEDRYSIVWMKGRIPLDNLEMNPEIFPKIE